MAIVAQDCIFWTNNSEHVVIMFHEVLELGQSWMLWMPSQRTRGLGLCEGLTSSN